FLFDFFHSREKFSKSTDPGNLLLCFCKRHCRRCPPCPATGVLGYTALRTDRGVIADLDMPNDANLTANQDTLTDLDTAGNSGLRCDNGVLSDHDVVRNLHQIIDLDALLNPSPAKTRAVHRRVRADLDVVIDLDNSQLLNFFLSAI